MKAHRMFQRFSGARSNPNLHSMWKTEGPGLYRNTEHQSEDHILLALSPKAGRELLEKVPGDAIDSATREFLLEKVIPVLHDRMAADVKSWEEFYGIGLFAYDRGPFVGGAKIQWTHPEALPDGFINDLHRHGFVSLTGEGTPEKGYFTQPPVFRADTPSKGQGALRAATREKVSLPVAIVMKQTVLPNLSPNLVLRVGAKENGYIPGSFIAATYRSPAPRGLVTSLKSVGFKPDAKLNDRLLSKDGSAGWSTYVLRPIR